MEQERVLFDRELGRAIAQWATVEMVLFFLLTTAIPTEKLAVLNTAYLSIENFRSKIQAIDLCIREAFPRHAALGWWSQIHRKLQTESAARNQLVHRIVQPYPANKAGRRVGLVKQIDSMPPALRAIGQESTLAKAPVGTLFIKDIVQCRLRFHALVGDILAIDQHLIRPSAPSLGSLIQPERLPTLESLRRQTLAELADQPGPSEE